MKNTLVRLVVCCGLTGLAESVPIGMLDTTDVTCGWGEVQIDRSVGRHEMKIGGRTFKRGLGVHAPSLGRFELDGEATLFEATVGLDDEEHGGGTAVFKVWGDGKLLWESGLMRANREPRTKDVKVDLTGVQRLTLEVLDGGDGKDCDHANWADACVTFKNSAGLNATTRQLGILTPKASPVPRINGPRVLGVRPGHPILFRVPVTGEGPMKVEVCNARSGTDRAPCSGRSCGAVGDCPSKGARSVPDRATTRLPSGLAFDPATRILSGQIDEPGEYKLVFKATNAKGAAERDFTIKVGETISLTPAMGWNSWNCFASGVTAEKVKAAADAMVSSGLADHGWQYVNIDDFWENNERVGKTDETLRGPARHPDGTIATNRRFPDMKGLADYVHAKGLKIGLYSSPGPTTCGGCTGSWQYEAQDAKTFADWGFDFLKYDWCSYGKVAMGKGLQRAMYPYLVMGKALREQNRDIVFSLCQYGMEGVSRWGAHVGGQSWRTTGDVFDSWRSISGSIAQQKQLWYFTKPGAWNDPDMLCVGKMRWNGFKGSRLTPNEQYTHISLWALVASPLMIGCDLTQLDEFTLSLLTNDEVIEIDQDPLGKGAARVAEGKGCEVWARPLADGSVAMGLYNKTLKEREVQVDLRALGLEGKWRIRDVWRQADEGVFEGAYAKSVPGHATHLVRLWPSAGGGFRRGMTDIRENAWKLEISSAMK